MLPSVGNAGAKETRVPGASGKYILMTECVVLKVTFMAESRGVGEITSLQHSYSSPVTLLASFFSATLPPLQSHTTE